MRWPSRPMARVGPSSNDIRPLYPAGAGVPLQEANLGAFAAEVGLRQLLTARYTLVLTVSMGWATNGPDYDLIMWLLVRLGYRVSHFSLSFSNPMPQPWGHGAAAAISCGEGSDDRPSSLNRDGSIRRR